MAITAYSSVSLSCYPSKSCRKAFNIHNYPSPFLHSSKSNAIELVPVAAALATLIAAEERAGLFNSSSKMEKVLFVRENDSEEEDEVEEMDSRNGALQRRRKRRRKRRQQNEVEHLITETETSLINNLLCSKPQKDGQYLTRKSEAEYSFFLKV